MQIEEIEAILRQLGFFVAGRNGSWVIVTPQGERLVLDQETLQQWAQNLEGTGGAK